MHDDLTVDHLSVLALLRSGEPPDADAIAAVLDLDADLVDDLLADLEERGLVR